MGNPAATAGASVKSPAVPGFGCPGRPGSAEVPGQLGSRADAEPYENVPQMMLDRARADDQACRDLLVRRTFGGEPRDLQLLGGQLLGGLRCGVLDGLSGRAQFGAGGVDPVPRLLIIGKL